MRVSTGGSRNGGAASEPSSFEADRDSVMSLLVKGPCGRIGQNSHDPELMSAVLMKGAESNEC